MKTENAAGPSAPAPGSAPSLDIAHLPDDATCVSCGNRAAAYACVEAIDSESVNCSERHLWREWSRWSPDGLLIEVDEEHFPADARGDEWEACGYCGCGRWVLPNTEARNAPPSGE